MAHFRFAIFAIAAVVTSCVASPSPKPDERKPARDESPDLKPNNQQSNVPGSTQDPLPPPTAAGSNQLDVVIVNAIGGENPDQASRQRDSLKGMLAKLAQKYRGQDVRFALIASPTASVSGVGVSLDSSTGFTPNNSQQLAFELASKDAFLGTLVAGCSAESSDLDSSHAPGTIKVCGNSVSIPAHAWSWAVDDLKGRLSSFLRPTAKRIYILVASTDVAMVTARQFVDLAAKQSGGNTPRIFAIAPTGAGGVCSDRNQRAAAIEESVKLSSGKIYSYCQSDWVSNIADLVQSL